MKEANYWKEKEKNKVNCKLPPCSAKDYFQPIVNKVSTKIECDDDFFIPKYLNSKAVSADVFVNCENKTTLAIHHQGFCSIDCGFSLEVQKGYKVCVELDSFWTNKGLILVGNKSYSGDFEKIKINVYNLGEKQIVINHKDKIAKIWIEPVYFFEWT